MAAILNRRVQGWAPLSAADDSETARTKYVAKATRYPRADALPSAHQGNLMLEAADGGQHVCCRPPECYGARLTLLLGAQDLPNVEPFIGHAAWKSYCREATDAKMEVDKLHTQRNSAAASDEEARLLRSLLSRTSTSRWVQVMRRPLKVRPPGV